MDKLLEVKNLQVELLTPYGRVYGVRGASFDISEGETVGLVGESGCGKTLTAKSVLGLHRPDRTEISGSILYRLKSGERVDLLKLSQRELRKIRGSEISMVLQDSSMSLCPIIPIGKQMADVITVHTGADRKEALGIAEKLLEDVGLTEPAMRLKCLPGELSGGQLQRICIAMAISSHPRLLIADEPTTALDSITQAQILALIKRLSAERKMAVLLVTHNFSVVKRLCDAVCVMYSGRIVERGPAHEVMNAPRHIYTSDLLKSIPDGTKRRLSAVPGSLPDVYKKIEGCPYRERCSSGCEECARAAEKEVGPGHLTVCIAAGGDKVG